ncbi:hypothetical protein [Dyadobacter luticola]|uniref:hypothetical protein n=1 Tax=Dyadobacter luticola TaxID=1979387 RepID=UPI00197A834C|nr:hypothetical protein [Dyadobacter luticola]
MSTVVLLAAFTGVVVAFLTAGAGFAVFLIVCALPSDVTNAVKTKAAKMVFSNLYIILTDGLEKGF